MKVGQRIIEIETKAGMRFFLNLGNSKFATQSANSLLNVSGVKDYKVFLNPDIVGALKDADKQKVVDAWVGHPGGILMNSNIANKFRSYWGINFQDELEFEALLRSRNDWFDDIFKTDLQ